VALLREAAFFLLRNTRNTRKKLLPGRVKIYAMPSAANEAALLRYNSLNFRAWIMSEIYENAEA
jgi:hypothetical protein